MVLHVDVDKLIKGTIIETNRVEYKSSWNPEKVLHTMCAFANDYEDTYGGYIVIGISEIDGVPDQVIGVDDSEVSRIEKELFNICNLIEPRYVPGFHVEKYQGKTIIVIWAYSDTARPFKCPVKVQTSERNTSERAYYIRRMSHTVRANTREEKILISKAGQYAFDEEINPNSSASDIERDLIIEYLNRVGSKIADKNMSTADLLDSLRLVAGPPEMRRAVNVALLMFSSDPEVFFPGCRIELVEKSFADGTNMVETIFTGPVDSQIRRVLQTIKNGDIKQQIFKVDGQAEAVKIWNYPYEALEEAIVNAVYHKDFLVREPVVITVTQNTIEIVTYPGLDPSISDEAIEDVDFRSFHTRNRRLGDFLKELDLVENRNTGIPKIRNELIKNGSPMLEYNTDRDRTYLEVVFHSHPSFVKDVESTATVVDYLDVPMNALIISMLRNNGCMTTGQISKQLGYSKVTGPVRKTIQSLMDEGQIEYLFPDNPRDPRQKICLKRDR